MSVLLTNQEMREADAYTIEALGIPAESLMERAGNALANEAKTLSSKGRILCVCGGGNNGGDGFVCARILKNSGRGVDVVCFSDKFSQETLKNRKRWLEIGGEIFTEIPNKPYTLIIDCLFGTGFKGGLQDENLKIVQAINKMKISGVKILSADIPSGVNGNGFVETDAVRADETLCIGEWKTGGLYNDAPDYTGILKKTDVGIRLSKSAEEYVILSDRAFVRKILPVRKRNSHKGTYGKAAIIAGSIEYTGAAFLSTAACLRSGVGYTSLFLPEELLPYYVLKSPEALLSSVCKGKNFLFEERFEQVLSYDAIAYGMGMGISEEVAKGATYLLQRYTGKLVLDADGLNSLAIYRKEELFQLFKNKKCDVICTPHLKEFSRLFGNRIEELQKDPISICQRISQNYAVNVYLKNAVSTLCGNGKTVVIATGNSGQAKGGSGDVLSGVIAGLCATGLSAFEAGIVGGYVVGKATEVATKKIGEYSLTASDIISYLGRAFLFVTEDTDECGKE